MRKLIILLSTVALLAGCAAAERTARPFDVVVLDYIMRLRWHDWNGAAHHLAESDRPAFLQRMIEDQDLRITDVRLEGVEIQGDGTQASTSLLFEYYRLPSATVRTHRAKQGWAYIAADRHRPGGWRALTPPPVLP